MKKFLCMVTLLVSSSVFAKAEPSCHYGNGAVCAIPGRCLLSQYEAGKVPEECEIGTSFANRCLAEKEQAVYQNNGACTKANLKTESANARSKEGPQNPTGDLVATPKNGNVPLRVALNFPVAWQALAEKLCLSRDSNREDERTLSIDWGDGTRTASYGDALPCPTHLYSKKGSYRVTAKFEARSDKTADYQRLLWEGSVTISAD